MELYISIIGAIVAIIVSVLGAILANKNTIILQTRKLKEEHYIAYIEALHNYAASDINDKDALKKASNTAIKRFIYCILLFFTPMIVEFLMSLFGAYGTCGIGTVN